MDKTLIKKFSEKKDKEKVQEFYEKILSILTSALNDLKSKKTNLFLDYDNTKIFPMGDYTNDTFIDQTGELEIVVACSNPQLIMANDILIKNLKEAKSKKEKNSVSNLGTYDEIIYDYANELVGYFDETTMILVTNQGIKILCLEEYNFKVLIRFATFDEEDKDAVLSFWDPFLHNFKKTNLFLYNEKMTQKDIETDGNYKKLVRIFKNFRKNILMNKWAMSNDLNKYLVELIAFNIPNEIMKDKDIELVFTKALNYLDNCNLLEFKSFDGSKIENFDLAKVSYSKVKNFITFLTKIAY